MEKNIEVKENKKPTNKGILALKIVLNVLFYALIIFLFLFSIMNIRGGNGTKDFPNIFGWGFLSVQSDSMERDPSKTIYPEWNDYAIGGFSKGDLLNVRKINQNDVENLKVGDVITYEWAIGSQPVLNTHRIVDITRDANGKVDRLYTQGDKVAQTAKYNPKISGAAGESLADTYEIVRPVAVKGIVTSVNSGVGNFLDFLQKNWLFIFVIPIIVLLVFEVFLVVRNIMILRGEKNKLELEATRDDLIADEKERMRQELLAEMRAQGLIPNEEKPVESKEEPQAEPEADNKAEETTVLVSEEKVQDETPAIEETKVEESTEQVEVQEEIKEEKVEETSEPTKDNEEVESEVAHQEEVTEEVEEPQVEEPVKEEEPVQEDAKEPEAVEEKKEPTKKASTKKTTTKKSTTKKEDK